MASDNASHPQTQDASPTHACGCLNITCIAVPPPSNVQPPKLQPASEYTTIYVADDGIRVAHPQVTMRNHTYSNVPEDSTTTRIRYTTISCLLCRSTVYRISRVVSSEAESRDGPILPANDWVEDEVLKSSTGFIEVHKTCLDAPSIASQRSSSSFSSLFSVVVPSALPASPTLAQRTTDELPSTSFLSHLKPIFSPPPFTPSHAAFVHLSSVAAAESKALRERAEQELADVVRQKVSEVEAAEAQIRNQVNALYKAFRTTVEIVENATAQNNSRTPLASRRRSSVTTSTVAPHNSATQPVNGFVPSPITQGTQEKRSTATPKVSTLSASLATSSFHHPRHQNASPDDAAVPGLDFTVPLAGQNPRTSQINTDNWETQDSSILDIQRQPNETLDTATSYRYFLIEDQMQKREQARNSPKPESNGAAPQTSAQGSGKTSGAAGSSTAGRDEGESQSRKPQMSSPRPKKDRKVTFDVDTDVVTIKREINSEKSDEAPPSNQLTEMMFDLEDGITDTFTATPSTPAKPILPLVERSQPRHSRPKSRGAFEQALSASYQAVRPASLPAFNLPLPAPERSSPEPVVRGQVAVPQQSSSGRQAPQEVDNREAELLKLVAANTPSHRGAWKRDSKAWKSFVDRQDRPSRNGQSSRSETEEEDDSEDSGLGDERVAFVGSLPINIMPAHGPRKEVLGLQSYKPESTAAKYTSSPSRTYTHSRTPSAAASRKAAYAERDRHRSMDPGGHDFALSDDEDDQDAEHNEEPSESTTREGERSRRHAQQILHARNNLPNDGMWRSLVT